MTWHDLTDLIEKVCDNHRSSNVPCIVVNIIILLFPPPNFCTCFMFIVNFININLFWSCAECSGASQLVPPLYKLSYPGPLETCKGKGKDHPITGLVVE
jgi:hypothetical protein